MLNLESHADAVFQAMNVRLYQKMLGVLQDQLAQRGYRFSQTATPAATLPPETLAEVGAAVLRIRILHQAPTTDAASLASQLERGEQEGEATLWASEMIATLAAQGVVLVCDTALLSTN